MRPNPPPEPLDLSAVQASLRGGGGFKTQPEGESGALISSGDISPGVNGRNFRSPEARAKLWFGNDVASGGAWPGGPPESCSIQAHHAPPQGQRLEAEAGGGGEQNRGPPGRDGAIGHAGVGRLAGPGRLGTTLA